LKTLRACVVCLFVPVLFALAATNAVAAPADAAASASPSVLKPSCDAVTEYGATANDATDDREALQKAINECEVVHVPAGRYFVSAPKNAFFNLNLPAGRSLVGAGRAATTLLQAEGAGPSVRLLLASGANVTISDLTLDGQKAIQSVDEHRAGVFATEAPGLVLRNLKSQNSSGDGFFIFKGSNDATVENVIAVDNERPRVRWRHNRRIGDGQHLRTKQSTAARQ
jgi:Pectate lyase superfamily protein